MLRIASLVAPVMNCVFFNHVGENPRRPSFTSRDPTWPAEAPVFAFHKRRVIRACRIAGSYVSYAEGSEAFIVFA